jgi:hypothetical protein
MHVKASSQGCVRRPFGRRNLFYPGLIESYQDTPLICFARDLTPDGARLLVKTALPPRFRLTVESKGVKADCELVDKGEGYVDVRFL